MTMKRNPYAQAHSLRGGAGAGKHAPKATRGSGKRGKGKPQRHPKHKGSPPTKTMTR